MLTLIVLAESSVSSIIKMNTADYRTGQLGITTNHENQENTAGTTTNTPTGSNPYMHSPSSTMQQKTPIGLPSFLLSNIQSFGNSKDKTTELLATLVYN